MHDQHLCRAKQRGSHVMRPSRVVPAPWCAPTRASRSPSLSGLQPGTAIHLSQFFFFLRRY
eukprot:3725129-Rhodomonas_salina.2